MAEIIRPGGNYSSFWRGHTIRSATNPLLISHLFPAAALIVGCYSEGGSRQRQACSSDLARATATSWEHAMVLWKAPFWGTWPKECFQFWTLYFRQGTYTHPEVTFLCSSSSIQANSHWPLSSGPSQRAT